MYHTIEISGIKKYMEEGNKYKRTIENCKLQMYL